MTLVQYKAWSPYAWEAWPTEPTSCASSMMVSCGPDMPTPKPEIRLTGDIVRFSYIQSGDRRFALCRELLTCLKQEGALWSCEFDDLHLMGYGYSLNEAIKRFMDDFAVAYDGLVNEEDDNLTEDARQMRDALRYLVARITPVEYGLDVDRQRGQTSMEPGMCLCSTR